MVSLSVSMRKASEEFGTISPSGQKRADTWLLLPSICYSQNENALLVMSNGLRLLISWPWFLEETTMISGMKVAASIPVWLEAGSGVGTDDDPPFWFIWNP
ncbi:hypothetical protein HPP92_003572 [Vanilla planifolia]|uniref:Uncharacterized protein n=1 Tax=Vanilla planifolia TaxID=51239 RepID=A0A835VNE6_VANPL|nr:hypothetical protein HPP92_003572 [Vanilla planifolia]